MLNRAKLLYILSSWITRNYINRNYKLTTAQKLQTAQKGRSVTTKRSPHSVWIIIFHVNLQIPICWRVFARVTSSFRLHGSCYVATHAWMTQKSRLVWCHPEWSNEVTIWRWWGFSSMNLFNPESCNYCDWPTLWTDEAWQYWKQVRMMLRLSSVSHCQLCCQFCSRTLKHPTALTAWFLMAWKHGLFICAIRATLDDKLMQLINTASWEPEYNIPTTVATVLSGGWLFL